jgi:DNA-binding winged helix-turn-helix (wHTH) protein
LSSRRPNEFLTGYNSGVNSRTESQPGAPLYRYRFGSAEFDEARFDLRVGGLRVDVEQRPLQVLLMLLRHAGEVITKEALLDEVWLGRPAVENVLANAVAKLRRALGVTDAELIQTVPRVGYRLEGPVERVSVGRQHHSGLELTADMPVPSRPHFQLVRQLGPTRDSEVWLAQNAKSGERRVYKFAIDSERLTVLKREATLYRVLIESLGERPDIARILDWNFETPPFFLECAYGGSSLIEWSQSGALLAATPDQRLELYLQIADAVAAAHSVGVLHKDLKPANVLIATSQHGTQLRLTDFGAGRLLEPARLEALGITRLGLTHTQALGVDTSGTLFYIAPELYRGQAPTVQSDVFALGVILYQFMVADFARPLTSGWERDIDDALLREEIAAATDGDPERRLKSAAQLADHIRQRERRRADRLEQIQAAQRAAIAERQWERSRARRPWIIAALVLLTVGLGVSVWFYSAARQSAQLLKRQFEVANALNTFMTQDLIGAANPEVNGHTDVKVLDAAKAASPRIDSVFGANSPMIQATLHSALQDSLSGMTDAEDALREGEKAIAAYERLSPPDRIDADRVRLHMLRDLARLGRDAQVPPLLRAVQSDLPLIIKERPLLQVEYLEGLALQATSSTRHDEALAYDMESWRLLSTFPQAPADLKNRIEFNLANSLMLVGRYPEADILLRELIERESKTLGPEHQQTLYGIVVLANSLLMQYKSSEAESILAPAVEKLERSLGPTHGRTMLAKRVIGLAYLSNGKYEEAARMYADSYSALAKKFGDHYQNTISTLEQLGIAQILGGHPQLAADSLEKSLGFARTTYGEDNAMTQHIRYILADCLLDLKRGREASELLRGLRVELLQQAEFTPDWPARLDFQSARVALVQGDAMTGRRLAQRALAAIQDPEKPRWDHLRERVLQASGQDTTGR